MARCHATLVCLDETVLLQAQLMAFVTCFSTSCDILWSRSTVLECGDKASAGECVAALGQIFHKLAVPARRNHRGSNLVAGQTCCVTDSQVSNLYAAARHWRICPPERDAIPILCQGERLPLRCTQTHGRQVTDPESLHYERRVKYPGLEVFASSKPDRG